MATPGAQLRKLHRAGAALKRHVSRADTDGDGKVTARDLRSYGHTVKDNFTVGRALVTMHSWALRENERGSSASVAHVKRKVDDALAAIDRKDANGNGTLDVGRELNAAKKLKTYQVLAEMSGQGDTAKLDTAALKRAVMRHAPKANFMSESDYSPQFQSVHFPQPKPMSAANIFAALQDKLVYFREVENESEPAELTYDASNARDSLAFLRGLGEADEGDEDDIKESAAAFAKIGKLMEENLTDIRHMKVGPKDDETGKLGESDGLYIQVIVGRTKDGNLAGIFLGDVET